MAWQCDVPTTNSRVRSSVWAALRAGPATVRQIHRATGVAPSSIITPLVLWERAGLVTSQQGKPKVFTLTSNIPEPPTVSDAGRVVHRVTGRQRMWSAIRVLKRFDLPTLMMASQANTRSAEEYINVLCRSGFLAVQHKGNSKRGDWSIYQLIRRSGPKSPRVNHKSTGNGLVRIVTDPNDGCQYDISPLARRERASADPADEVCVG